MYDVAFDKKPYFFDDLLYLYTTSVFLSLNFIMTRGPYRYPTNIVP